MNSGPPGHAQELVDGRTVAPEAKQDQVRVAELDPLRAGVAVGKVGTATVSRTELLSRFEGSDEELPDVMAMPAVMANAYGRTLVSGVTRVC